MLHQDSPLPLFVVPIASYEKIVVVSLQQVVSWFIKIHLCCYSWYQFASYEKTCGSVSSTSSTLVHQNSPLLLFVVPICQL